MKKVIDCVVLVHSGHESWLPTWIDQKYAFGRVSFHRLDLGNTPSIYALKEIEYFLKRYDIAMLPITTNTLSWTRSSLAQVQAMISIPIFGLVKDVKAGGMQDLLDLGLSHYQMLEVGLEHIRVALVHSMYRQSHRYREYAENLANNKHQQTTEKSIGSKIEVASSLKTTVKRTTKEPKESFKKSKARTVAEFEKHYISEVLASYHGNISKAARAAQKNRRAFWELMRKHKIDVEQYKKA